MDIISVYWEILKIYRELFHCKLQDLRHAVLHLVEALCYKSEVRVFDSRCCLWNFSLI